MAAADGASQVLRQLPHWKVAIVAAVAIGRLENLPLLPIVERAVPLHSSGLLLRCTCVRLSLNETEIGKSILPADSIALPQRVAVNGRRMKESSI